MSNIKSTNKELDIQENYCDIHRLSTVFRILILIYTFFGVSYLLFIKSNPKCDCTLLSTKKLLPEYLPIPKDISTPHIPTSIAPSGSNRNLLAINTPTLSPTWPTQASIKHNHDLITNLYDMLPNGIVIIWYGLISNIPAGWSLCDGTNGTPDLRDKFVIGGGNLYNLNDIGGSIHTTLSINHLPTHSHDITNVLSTTHTGHTHNTGTFSLSNQRSHSHTFNSISTAHNGHEHSCSTNTLNSGSHSHTCSAFTDNEGSHAHSCSASTTKDGEHDHTCSAATNNDGTHSHPCSASTNNDGTHNHINNAFKYLLQARDDCTRTAEFTDETCGEPDVSDMGMMMDDGLHNHIASCTITNDGLHKHTTSCTTGTAVSHGHTTICDTESVGSHRHSVTNCSTGNTGNHNHDANCTTLNAGSHTHSMSGITGSSASHSHSISGVSGNDGVHSHTITGTTDSIGNGNIINILNPYYTAYYIMKIPHTFPTDDPTLSPTLAPTNTPTIAPTNNPTQFPTISPSKSPSKTPTQPPTLIPTLAPSKIPTKHPTNNPTNYPSKFPTNNPSNLPSKTPTKLPSLIPSKTPSRLATSTPTLTFNPTKEPTISPTVIPSFAPILEPTLAPSLSPTSLPTSPPSNYPSISPSITPSLSPTSSPTSPPSQLPTLAPTLSPTPAPSNNPSIAPSITPTTPPTISPTVVPTMTPSNYPTFTPSFSSPTYPSNYPTLAPTLAPSLAPTSMPTVTCWDGKFKWYMIKSINLNRNDMLLSGESLVSVNCRFILTMKENGNLILNGIAGEYIDPFAKDENGNFINVENKMIIYNGWQTNTTIKDKSGDESISVTQLKNGTLMIEQRELFAIGTGAAEFVPIELWKSNQYNNENELILQLSDNGCLILNEYKNGSINTDHLSPIWSVCAKRKTDNNNNVITSTIIPNDDSTSLNYVDIHGKIRLLLFWNVVISGLLVVLLCGCLCMCLKLLYDNYKIADSDSNEFSPVTAHDDDDADITLNDEMINAIELWSMEAENCTNITGQQTGQTGHVQSPGVMQATL